MYESLSKFISGVALNDELWSKLSDHVHTPDACGLSMNGFTTLGSVPGTGEIPVFSSNQ